MAPHGNELSEDLKKRTFALHKDGVGYNKIAKTLKLNGSTVAKTIQQFNRTGSTQNRPWVHVLSIIYRDFVWEIDVWVLLPALLQRLKVSLSVLRPYAAHCIKLVCMDVVPEGSLFYLLKMMHKKARKQFAEDKQIPNMD